MDLIRLWLLLLFGLLALIRFLLDRHCLHHDSVLTLGLRLILLALGDVEVAAGYTMYNLLALGCKVVLRRRVPTELGALGVPLV